jgi:hypothetical protein
MAKDSLKRKRWNHSANPYCFSWKTAAMTIVPIWEAASRSSEPLLGAFRTRPAEPELGAPNQAQKTL